MNNKTMQRMLEKRQAIDVSGCERLMGGDYLLTWWQDGADYCDAVREHWIWSIGKVLRPLPSVMADNSRRVLQPGVYLASTTNRHYSMGKSPTIECVFLR